MFTSGGNAEVCVEMIVGAEALCEWVHWSSRNTFTDMAFIKWLKRELTGGIFLKKINIYNSFYGSQNNCRYPHNWFTVALLSSTHQFMESIWFLLSLQDYYQMSLLLARLPSQNFVGGPHIKKKNPPFFHLQRCRMFFLLSFCFLENNLLKGK